MISEQAFKIPKSKDLMCDYLLKSSRKTPDFNQGI